MILLNGLVELRGTGGENWRSGRGNRGGVWLAAENSSCSFPMAGFDPEDNLEKVSVLFSTDWRCPCFKSSNQSFFNLGKIEVDARDGKGTINQARCTVDVQ